MIPLVKLEEPKSAAHVDVLPYEAIKRVLGVGLALTGEFVMLAGS